MAELTTAAVVGCGVIGAGWAARLRLNSVDVRVVDPSPDAANVLTTVHEHATQAWNDLDLEPTTVGTLTVCDDVGDACSDVGLVVESVPERLDVKHATLAGIDAAASGDAIVASSTSGFRPTQLAEAVDRPERLIVGHPFNPVYLLPLVEVVGGDATAPETIDRAMSIYRQLGMHPLHVRAEVDAHIADRLLEAVWREALWLVNDGVATTGEIDDAIRYGFGLRWAQMGLFETYRVAGGEGGMRHFIGQFGEALTWPWTKLMDVPDLTDDLIDTIVDQSDAQSGHASIRELERTRDRNLAAILLALEQQDAGAGRTLSAFRAELG